MRTVNGGFGLVLLAQALAWGGWWLVDRRHPTADRGLQRRHAFLAVVTLLGALYFLGRWVLLR
jgi:hypothetical protein